jgi:hypothetical protein
VTHNRSRKGSCFCAHAVEVHLICPYLDATRWAPPEPEKPTWLDGVIGVQAADILSAVGTAVRNVVGNVAASIARDRSGSRLSDRCATRRRAERFVRGQRSDVPYPGQRYEANLPTGVFAPVSAPLRNLAATDEFFRCALPGCCGHQDVAHSCQLIDVYCVDPQGPALAPGTAPARR